MSERNQLKRLCFGIVGAVSIGMFAFPNASATESSRIGKLVTPPEPISWLDQDFFDSGTLNGRSNDALTIAQLSGSHSEHHPDSAPKATAPAANAPSASGSQSGNPSPMGAAPQSSTPPMAPPGTAGAGMMGGMGEMGKMMEQPRKEFYPSLMALPSLTSEQRREIETQARARLGTGIEEFTTAENALRHAQAATDIAGMEQAILRLRAGLDQVQGAVVTLRSLADGQPPPQIALDWFKNQMSLPTDTPVLGPSGLLGISWFHLTTMALVTAFAAIMLILYLARMRRAKALVYRLTTVPSTPAVAPPQPAPAAPMAPPPSAPRTSSSPVRANSTSAALQAGTPEPAQVGPWKGKLRVAAIFDETPNVKTFRLMDPDGGSIPFRFLPGQFLTYSAEIDGKLVRRSYTIASSAAQTAYVETTIKREENGIFSDYMHRKIGEGDLIDVLAPSGRFTFTGKEADSVVLIGGGVGITPLMAAIRYLADIAWPGEIFLVYGSQSTENFIFRDELEHRQRRMGNLHVAATMARAAGTSWMGPEGPITKSFLLQSVPNLASRRVHLCGPPGMMEAMKGLLAEIGVSPDQIKTEAFGPARGAVPPPGVTVVSPLQSINGQPAASSPGSDALPGTPAIGPATASIRFVRSNKVAPLPPDKTVLEVAESIGVPIDYSCRAGICGVCQTKLLEGSVTMEVEDALTAEDKAQGYILACQAKSIGNLAIEA